VEFKYTLSIHNEDERVIKLKCYNDDEHALISDSFYLCIIELAYFRKGKKVIFPVLGGLLRAEYWKLHLKLFLLNIIDNIPHRKQFEKNVMNTF
jgi:hypothetical protein